MTTTQRLSATSAEQLRLDALGRELSVDEIYRDPLSVRVPLVAWRALRVNVHSLVAASTARVTLAPRGHVACCPSCAKTHVAAYVRCSLSPGACCIALFQTAKKAVFGTRMRGALAGGTCLATPTATTLLRRSRRSNP